ncbi:epoxyqueuosine reductase QueH [candidate division KSB1 bacterium]|nr:epoxyqueuosine reductase QueH [candidate division KSB1 bacterium]
MNKLRQAKRLCSVSPDFSMIPRLLLHVCCAPDATVVIERLRDEYDITLFFYNPNIHPAEEYYLRLRELQQLADKLNLPCQPADYDCEDWFNWIKGLESDPEGGRRCEVCFHKRLEKTAQIAASEGFDMFATVLTVSPHKNAQLINLIGSQLGIKYQVPFLEANFKKKDGFKRSLELCRQFGLYRQDYCGCIFSRNEREIRKKHNGSAP